MFCSYCLLQTVSFGGPQKELISLLKVPTVGRVQEEKKITAAEASDQRRRIKGSAMDGNRQCVACFAWELVSAVSKTRARTEKNQMWPLADGSQGAPQSLDPGDYVTSLARWLTH